jgi:hypothetical protein
MIDRPFLVAQRKVGQRIPLLLVSAMRKTVHAKKSTCDPGGESGALFRMLIGASVDGY